MHLPAAEHRGGREGGGEDAAQEHRGSDGESSGPQVLSAAHAGAVLPQETLGLRGKQGRHEGPRYCR